MKQEPEKLRIRRHITVREVNWSSVTSIVSARYGGSKRCAEKRVQDFRRRLLHPFNPHWFRRKNLSYIDEQIATALSVHLRADTLTLTKENPLRVGPVCFRYAQSHTFTPKTRRSAKDPAGEFSVHYSAKMMGREILIDSFWGALALHCFFVFFAICSYLILLSALMYSAAVFIVFLSAPKDTAYAALNNSSIALALLCFTSVVVALFGRAAMNIFGLLTAGRDSRTQ